jgi:hypothetical protein
MMRKNVVVFRVFRPVRFIIFSDISFESSFYVYIIVTFLSSSGVGWSKYIGVVQKLQSLDNPIDNTGIKKYCLDF